MERKNVCFVMFTLTKHCQCRLHAGFSPLCLPLCCSFIFVKVLPSFSCFFLREDKLKLVLEENALYDKMVLLK